MNPKTVRLKTYALKAIETALLPVIYAGAKAMKFVRLKGVERLKRSGRIFMKTGVFPVTDHYYDPKFNYEGFDFSEVRSLHGLDMNLEGQIELIASMNCYDELLERNFKKLMHSDDHVEEYPFFFPVEAEFYYSVARKFRSSRIIEIGAGFSTIAAKAAADKMNQEVPGSCSVTCIEPYENPWLEKLGVDVIRKKLEDVDESLFRELKSGDILFVDTSHVIKPGGEILMLFWQIFPLLPGGVIIHIHDIFTPRHYPEEWMKNRVSFWNEQYFLEAFLSGNRNYEIIGALNHLYLDKNEILGKAFPSVGEVEHQEPASFWLRKL